MRETLLQTKPYYNIGKCLFACFPRFTLDAETVMVRLEDEKTSPEESHEKQVGYCKVSES